MVQTAASITQNGFQAVGIILGFKSEPWRNDPTKFNHRILLANPFLDGNGFQQTEVMSIDITHDDVQRLQQLTNEFKGKQDKKIMFAVSTQ